MPPVIFPYRDSTLTNCCVNKWLAVPRLTLESWLVAEYVLCLPCSSVPPVIPYRDSTLTKLLYEGLKGNGRVLMMACCSPSKVHLLHFLFPPADYAVQEMLFFTSVLFFTKCQAIPCKALCLKGNGWGFMLAGCSPSFFCINSKSNRARILLRKDCGLQALSLYIRNPTQCKTVS